MISAAVYVRKSTAADRDDGKSEPIERQIENARAYAQAQGWQVADSHVYVDKAISGGIFIRPGLNALLDALKTTPPPFTRVVVAAQDRLGRDVGRTLLLIEAIEEAGAQIWSYSDHRQISCLDEAGEQRVTLSGMVDSGEKRRARRRTREGLAKKAREGYVVGALAWGYEGERIGGEHGHTEFRINETQAAGVRRIYLLYAGGLGSERIIKALKEEGAPAPSHGWSKGVIRGILNRRMYQGVIETRHSSGDGKLRGQESLVTVQAPHLRIIDPDLAAQVQARLDRQRAVLLRDGKGRLHGKPELSVMAKHLCNSIARCHVCGGPLVYFSKGRDQKTPMYYCGTRKAKGALACSNAAGVPVEGLDYAVTVKLADLLNRDFETVMNLVEEQTRVWREARAVPKAERAQLEREAKRLESAISRLMDNIEAGQAVTDRLKKRQEELDTIKSKLDTPAEFDRDGLRSLVGSLGPLVGLGEGDPAVIRQVLRKIGVQTFTVYPVGDGWRFEGVADFGASLSQRRSDEGGRRGPLRRT